MGFWSGTPKDRIPFHELDKHLSDLKFSSSDRRELKSFFEKHKSDGISKDHIKKIAKGLRDDYKDKFNSYHADKLQKGLIAAIDTKMKPKDQPKVQVEKNPKPAQVYEFKRPQFNSNAGPSGAQTPPAEEREGTIDDLLHNSKDYSKAA